MIKLLDKLFEFCASLKLAIFLILSLAFYLGSATVYEARYGTRAPSRTSSTAADRSSC